MSTPLDAPSLPGISSPPLGTNAPPTPSRHLLTLIANALTHYPVIKLIATHLHDTELINLMLTSRAVYYAVAPSRAAIKSFTCRDCSHWKFGGIHQLQGKFGCWCCGAPICDVCPTWPYSNSEIPPLTIKQYCSYDVFLPGATARGVYWPTKDDKLFNDKFIRNPACDYQFSDAKRCCLGCWKKPAWWVKEKYQERAKRDRLFFRKSAK